MFRILQETVIFGPSQMGEALSSIQQQLNELAKEGEIKIHSFYTTIFETRGRFLVVVIVEVK